MSILGGHILAARFHASALRDEAENATDDPRNVELLHRLADAQLAAANAMQAEQLAAIEQGRPMLPPPL